MKTKNSLLLLFISVLFVGCVSQPKKAPTENSVWRYDTKAQITDKTKSESNTISIEIFTYLKSHYRMEVTATLGYSVASVAMNTAPDQSGVRYILYPQKAFVQGPMGPKSFRNLFKMNLDPNLVVDLIEDRHLKKYDFLCGRQTDNVIKCTNDEFELLMEKPPKDSDAFVKKFTLDSKTFRLVWVFKSKEFNNGYTDDMLDKTFVLERPEGFKQLNIK